MATKRHHNKSRRGCDRCRVRRVKCDEKEPSCTNCANRREKCLYFKRATFEWRSKRSPSTGNDQRSDSSAASKTTIDTPGPSRRRDSDTMQELRLMHQWCAYASQGFSFEATEVFRQHVTSEAFRYEYLLDSIFATTALRIAVEAAEANDIDTSRSNITIALRHQNRCLPSLRKALCILTRENCDAVLCTTMALMVCAMVSPLVSAGPNDDCDSTVEALLKVVDFINGIVSVDRMRTQWEVTGPLASIMEILKKPPPVLNSVFPTKLLHSLNNIRTADDAQREVFSEAIDKLDNTLREDDKILPWPVMVPAAFLEELGNGNFVAKCIFMHWGVLLYYLDGLWWSRFSGKALVDELSRSLIEDESGPVRELKNWCRNQVQLPCD